MSNLQLVIGDARYEEHARAGEFWTYAMEKMLRRVPERLYSTPRPDEWVLIPPARLPLERLRRWQNREMDGSRMRIALWLELIPAALVPLGDAENMSMSPAKHVRIDLRMSCDPIPKRCKVLQLFDQRSHYWSHSTEQKMYSALQMSADSRVYGATSNFVGVLEMQWPDRAKELDFVVEYKLYSERDWAPETVRLEGKAKETQ